MSKFLSLVKKHLVLSVAILLGVTAVLVAGISFLASYVSYTVYSKNYDKMKADLLVNSPQPPEKVLRDNEYVAYDDANGSIISTKSSYGSTYLLSARDAEIDLDDGQPEFVSLSGTSWEVATGFTKGGSITFKINVASSGMSDVDVYLGWGEYKNIEEIANLVDYVNIKFNGFSVTTADFDLPKDGSLQQLVLKNAKLITGENTLVFETTVSSNNNFIMPAIAAVTFITDVDLAE